ncbi:MAG TPA: hypothetical protein VGF67_18615 [Ktedonobacteraceae bacterium]
MSEAEPEKRPLKHIVVPLEWHVPDSMRNAYADNVTAQPRAHDVILSFFETQPPVLGGDAEKNRVLLEGLGAIRAECVGKIVVAADLVPEIIRVLQIAYDGYLTAKEQQKDV